MSRRINRPPVRRKTWNDFTWPHTALPPQPVAGAAIAEPGTVPDGMRQWWVHVVVVGGRVRAYCGDGYQAVESAACRHGVSAVTGAEARALAVAEHKERCAR